MGRPTSLTPEVHEIIIAAVGRGLYLETAAALASVTGRSIQNWKLRGEAGEAPYEEFFLAIKKAEAEAESATISRVDAGEDGWQSAGWKAERRWPSRWSGRVRLTVNEELSNVLKRIEQKLDPETFAKVVDATREDAATGSAPTH